MEGHLPPWAESQLLLPQTCPLAFSPGPPNALGEQGSLQGTILSTWGS